MVDVRGTLTQLDRLDEPVVDLNGNGSVPPDDPAAPAVFERPPDDPIEIVCNNRQLRTVTRDVLHALRSFNEPPIVFVRGGALTRVRNDERGRPIVEAMGTDVLRYRIARVANTMRVNQDGAHKAVPPPLDAVRDIAAAGDWPDFPPLEAVVEIPTLRSDGSIHYEPGYDPITRLLHVPARGLEVPEIPDVPDDSDVDQAVKLIDEALCDFPFDTPSDRANAIAAMLTPIVRPAIDGQVPLALVDAPEPGTGKGLLVNLVSVIATGRPAAMRPLAAHDDEVRKMITSTLAEGPTIVALDNIEDAIRSPSLALVLTSDEWADRLLGRSETVKLPNRATWMATGNNLQVGGDLGRRCYRIRLDARQAKPYSRPASSFRHPDLLDWAQQHRGELIAALLTIARHWYAIGQPDVDVPPLGGFTPWARLAGSVLHHAGIIGFLDNLAQFHAEADRDADEWDAFLTAWRESFGPKVVTVSELAERIDPQVGGPLLRTLPSELANAVGRPGFAKTLGRQLRSKAGRHFGADGLHIVDRGKDRSKVVRWSVERADENLFATVTNLENAAADSDEIPATTAHVEAGAESNPPDARGYAGSRGESYTHHAREKGYPQGETYVDRVQGYPRNPANPAGGVDGAVAPTWDPAWPTDPPPDPFDELEDPPPDGQAG
jgi:hypothetical protein